MVQASEVLTQTAVSKGKAETLGAVNRLRIKLAGMIDGWRNECQLYGDQIRQDVAIQIEESASKVHNSDKADFLIAPDLGRTIAHNIVSHIGSFEAGVWARGFELGVKLTGGLRNKLQPKSESVKNPQTSSSK